MNPPTLPIYLSQLYGLHVDDNKCVVFCETYMQKVTTQAMERYCRLCAETKEALSCVSAHKLHSSDSDATISLAEIVQDYLTISIKGAHSEALICFDCLKIIEEWHFFREKCLENERQFQKQEIHFEVVITSDATYDSYHEECHAKEPEQRKNPDEKCRNACENEEENGEHFSDLPSVNRGTSPAAKPLLLSIKKCDAVVKHSDQIVRKFQRRLKTRRNAVEKSMRSGVRIKRGRSKVQDKESKKQRISSLKLKREKPRVLPKICTICGVSRTDMAAHMRWHNDERPYQCPHCPKVFVNSSNLRNHINLHTREKLYKCELCDKEFPSSTARSKHRETHSTVNAHLCAICGKSFKYRASLARHKLIHFVEPKVKCTVCDMVFLTKTRLTKHLLVHVDSKPFSCDICNRSFNRKDNLKTHMKTHLKTIKSEKMERVNQRATQAE